ncbi:hypothetical protein E2C01_051966 [Portunus trituberculatus]|uniref:Uncharacterized protein n=1 Tax=Portunus trituberculatus TaxID=210409 RepID=A0A5B7GN48_PORTR|nr:hypothetical protein [Portunus trituberculatus]
MLYSVHTNVSECSSLDNVQAVETRSTKRKRVHPFVMPPLTPLEVTPTEFVRLVLVSLLRFTSEESKYRRIGNSVRWLAIQMRILFLSRAGQQKRPT